MTNNSWMVSRAVGKGRADRPTGAARPGTIAARPSVGAPWCPIGVLCCTPLASVSLTAGSWAEFNREAMLNEDMELLVVVSTMG